MRIPESQIKQAILHPEHEVRLTALEYFADTFTQDTSVMPLVIEAVEKYGRESALPILRRADHLPQSALTIDWLIAELRRDFDVADVNQDNYRFALAVILLEADPELLVRRHKEITSVASFPPELRGLLDLRLRWHFLDWPELWTEFERPGTVTKLRAKVSPSERRLFNWIVRALSRHRSETGRVIALLQRQYDGPNRSLIEWLEPEVVRLAGHMKLEAAVPILMSLLREGEESVMDEIGPALGRIGGDRVVEAIENDWSDSDCDRKSVALEALSHICSDLSLRKCLEFFEEEGEFEVEVDLCHCLLAHLATDAIEPVRQCVLGDDEALEPDQRDIRWNLVATATVMGATFPEYEQWHQEAIISNYGRGKDEPVRLADAFR